MDLESGKTRHRVENPENRVGQKNAQYIGKLKQIKVYRITSLPDDRKIFFRTLTGQRH
jgi:hypothetical protein